MARRGFDAPAADSFHTPARPMERLPTRLDGLVLLAPAVHGDARGFFIETFRADAWAAAGVPTEFVQDNHSRSRRGTLRGIHFQTAPGPGQARARRARPRAGRGRRPAPRLAHVRRVGGRRARRRAGPRSCTSRSASAHGFCVLSETADFVYKCTAYYDAATEAGIRFDDPDVGIEWPRGRRAPLLRARPRRRRGWPTWPTRCRSATTDEPRRALRAEPDRHAAPRQPAHGAAGVAVRAHGRRALPRAHGGPRPRPRRSAGVGRAAAARPARDRAGLGRRGRVPVQPPSRLRGGARAAASPPGWSYECFCTRAEIRAAASAPHGPLPEGAYPGTCLRLTEAERRRKRAGGRPPALRVRAEGARVAFTDRLHGPQEGVVDDFVVRRNDGAPAYNLAVIVDDAWQGIGEVVRGDDLLDSTPRQLFLAGAARPRRADLRARPARARAGRQPARQAPRRGHARRPRPRARRRAGWRRRSGWTARPAPPRCASASTRARCRGRRPAGRGCRAPP